MKRAGRWATLHRPSGEHPDQHNRDNQRQPQRDPASIRPRSVHRASGAGCTCRVHPLDRRIPTEAPGRNSLHPHRQVAEGRRRATLRTRLDDQRAMGQRSAAAVPGAGAGLAGPRLWTPACWAGGSAPLSVLKACRKPPHSPGRIEFPSKTPNSLPQTGTRWRLRVYSDRWFVSRSGPSTFGNNTVQRHCYCSPRRVALTEPAKHSSGSQR